MIKFISGIVIGLCVLACSVPSCGCDPVMPSFITGKWRLEKIIYGYPPPNSPSFSTDVKNQVYVFDEALSKYEVLEDNIKIESGSFLLERSADNRSQNLNFIEKKTYSTYTFTENNKVLSLYQRTPVGAVLADGSTFQYRKIEN